MHIPFVLHAVADQFSYRQHFQLMCFAELNEIRHARHGTILAHDFADDSCRHESGHAGQVDRSFGLPSPHEHTAFARAKRKNVAGAGKIRRPSRRINGNKNCARTIVRRNTRRDAVARVNRLAESCAIVGGILGAHGANA